MKDCARISQRINFAVIALAVVAGCSAASAELGADGDSSSGFGDGGGAPDGGGSAGPMGTRVSGIDLHATIHNVGIQVNFSGDSDANANATVEVSINGAEFTPVHRLSRVMDNRFVGSIFDWSPRSQVQVRVTVHDPGGVDGAVQAASIKTRPAQVPMSTGSRIQVSTSFGAANGDGSSARPYATIQQGVDEAAPGDTVLIHSGTYHERVVLVAGPTGTENAPLTIANAGDGEVILDGSDPALDSASAWRSEGGGVYSAAVVDTYYVGIDGRRLWRYDTRNQLDTLAYGTDGGFAVDTTEGRVFLRLPSDAAPAGHRIQVSTLHDAFEMTCTSDVVFDGMVFRNYNLGPHSSSISLTDMSSRIWVVNNRFEQSETGVRLEGLVVDTVVMNNEFSDAGVNAFDWELVKEFQWWLEHGALYVTNDEYSGYGTVFYRN